MDSGTWPVMQMTGMESSLASAMAVRVLVGSGTGSGKENRGLAADPGHALGDESGPLLMPRQDMPDAARGKGVVQGQIGPARYPGNGFDALPLQTV